MRHAGVDRVDGPSSAERLCLVHGALVGGAIGIIVAKPKRISSAWSLVRRALQFEVGLASLFEPAAMILGRLGIYVPAKSRIGVGSAILPVVRPRFRSIDIGTER